MIIQKAKCQMDKTKRIVINGVVQGVGFRPFVYKIARQLGVYGFVLNSSKGVIIEITSSDEKIEKFIKELKEKKPPHSEISKIDVMDLKFKKFKEFKILKSSNDSNIVTSIPSDLAVCDDCIKDIFDENNRRFLYPFTNCTNCGPRFSIIEKIPYDRKYTTMKKFRMCADCKAEYEEPSDRRFHAQPNACSLCGPRVWVVSSQLKIIKKGWLDYIVKRIKGGNIVLIKGLGGFHISCDAFNQKAVSELRVIKKRDFKPFAVMVDDIKYLSDYLYINEEEKKLLHSPKAPIVMLRKKENKLFEFVAPLIDSVGVMMAYTPLHRIIFKDLRDAGFKSPLVMTSGNFKDEPIIKENDEAMEKFSGFDILLHNRDIKNRIDDSVVFLDEKSNIRLIRRARGYVPDSIKINSDIDLNIFASGADIKNVFGFYRKGEVILSQYIGDLEIKENRDFFVNSYKNIKKLFGLNFDFAVIDMHPSYYSSELTKKFKIKNIIQVQHHISHIYSVMAENNLKDNVIGVSFDGTGYGLDGNIWGGEFFLMKNKEIKRVAHFDYIPLCGGDIVTKEIWRSFASLFYRRRDFVYDFLKSKVDKKTIDIVFKMMDKKINSPLSSAVGRIFDAVSVIVTGDVMSEFEASGPMKMENMAYKTKDSYKFDILNDSGTYIIKSDSIIDDIITDYKNGKKNFISAKFHNSLLNIIKYLCVILSEEYSIYNICFSGGVFQNRFLVNSINNVFDKRYRIFLNSKVPSNDGGIALGQIYYAIRTDKIIFHNRKEK